VLQSLAEGLVNALSFVVTLGLLSGLLLESLTLFSGNVQLGVAIVCVSNLVMLIMSNHSRIANFLLANESLESLAKTGNAARALGKRRHHLGVTSDEGRVGL
jgi:hypothetical protein